MTDRKLFEGPATLSAAQREISLDPLALAAARRFVEDHLVEMRDCRLSAPGGNGLVIRERDGTPSNVIRLSTRDALTLGIRAYLASLGASE
jgi:hypothetical protein